MMRPTIRRVLPALWALVLLGAAPLDTYVVNPAATPATKAAIEAGRAPGHGLPVIESVVWSSTTVRPGSVIEATVVTSTNINWVEGRYKDWNFAFQRTALGHFHVTYKVPWLPPFLIGHWKIDVIARSIDGVEVWRPFDFKYSYF